MVRPLHPVCTDRTISIGIEHGGKGNRRLIPVNLNDGLFNADGIIVEVPVGNVGKVLFPCLPASAHVGKDHILRHDLPESIDVSVGHGLTIARLGIKHGKLFFAELFQVDPADRHIRKLHNEQHPGQSSGATDGERSLPGSCGEYVAVSSPLQEARPGMKLSPLREQFVSLPDALQRVLAFRLLAALISAILFVVCLIIAPGIRLAIPPLISMVYSLFAGSVLFSDWASGNCICLRGTCSAIEKTLFRRRTADIYISL